MVDLAGQIFVGQSCTPHSFTYPEVFGATFTKLEANLVTNYSLTIPQGLYYSHFESRTFTPKFCNVSLEYTHARYNDNINTQVWLPLDGWNGRLQGSGGGGFQTGLDFRQMAGAVSEGYSVLSTDGGHHGGGFDLSWALSSPGNLNWALVQDFASSALNEASLIGKAITNEFYGRPATKSYFNGCSMGGRQGLQLAQRFPTAYDGILAAAPAINGPKFIVTEFWPQMIMHEAGGVYPAACEFDAITRAAIEACDELDGVKDGVISSPELCSFNAETLVGKTIKCEDTGTNIKVSEISAKVASSAWEGAKDIDGSFVWYGLEREAPLTGLIGLANTNCNKSSCQLEPFPIPAQFIKYFVLRDADVDLTKLKHEELVYLVHRSHNELGSILATDDPDLSAFHKFGGKIITWHGLADQVIMPNGTREYYDAVLGFDPNAKDYYRLFEAPGVYHCSGGPGPYPGTALSELVKWVEEGDVPDTLPARSVPDVTGEVFARMLCAYPQKVRYKGSGDIHVADSFECA